MRPRVVVALTVALAACTPPEPPTPVEAPRPVTVIELKRSDPVRPLLITGSVQSWKEQDVAFEVEGVVRFVVEPGTNLEGRWVEGETVQVEGGVLAEMDRRSHRIARDQAAALVDVAKEQLRVAHTQLEKVLPANLKARQAELVRAEEEWKRIDQLVKKGAATEVDLIRAVADRDARQAGVEEVLASMEAQKAEIKSLEAQVKRAGENLAQAEFDLSRCTLQAPFSGEVSEVYIEAGGYARRGDPVAHLVMMMPIKIDVAISADTARRLRRGDVVRYYLEGEEEPGRGAIYDVATTADPETRTFRVSILTGNERTGLKFPEGDPRAGMPRVSFAMPLKPARAIVCAIVEEKRGLHEDGQGHYVWADPTKTVRASVPDGTVLHLKKYRVRLGERRVNFQGLYLMREVTDAGGLPPEALIPLDVPDSDRDELQVVLTKPQWRLRPGQLVPVLLGQEAPPPGLYLPMDAIRPEGEGTGTVFVVADGKARGVPVAIRESIRQLFRVEGELNEGDLVVTDYIHFLQDGDAVRVIKRRGTG